MYRVSAIGFACIIVAACAGQVDYGHDGGVEYGRRLAHSEVGWPTQMEDSCRFSSGQTLHCFGGEG